MVFLCSLSCNSLARNQDRTPTTSPFIWDGDLSHGRDDSIHLSFTPLSHLCRSITVGLVVCLSLGSGLNSLFYQDTCPSATKSQCHSQLDRSLCRHCSSSFDLSRCGNKRDCLSRFSDWFWFDLSSLSPYLS